jgi:predicted component of type VI protein secretion system
LGQEVITVLYTSSDSIRAVAGVSAVEFPDDVLSARNLEAELGIELLEWLPAHADVAAARSTPEEVALSDALGLYCANYCAASLLRPLALLTKVSDGKNSMERNVDYAEAARLTGAAARKYRDYIQFKMTGEPPPTWSPLAVVAPTLDPVTG